MLRKLISFVHTQDVLQNLYANKIYLLITFQITSLNVINNEINKIKKHDICKIDNT